MDLTCEHCQTPIPYPGRGRPPSRFCSRKCKDAARQATRHAEVLQKRAGQRCENCGGPIPLTAGSRVRTCSRACSVAWQNAKRQEAKRAAWLASRPTCQRCGDPIPESRPRNVKYCSPECKKKAADARWRASSPGYNRMYNYGITPEEFDAKMAEQGGVCAACLIPGWEGKGNAPNTDHDHRTGAFRGILHGNCNNGLGNFKDDPARLRAAADYLERTLVMTP